MVGRSDGSFVLMGAVSLDGAPLPPSPHGAETLLYGRAACLFRAGPARELHILQQDGLLLAVAGRTFAPFAIHPGAHGIEDKLRRLEAQGPGGAQGSFALVRIDVRAGLRLATDRYGFRPLFYRRLGGLLLFATHLRGIAALAPLPAFDADALLHYYNFGVTPNDRTLLDGIRKVPPGSMLVAEGGQVRVGPYVRLGRLFDPGAFATSSEEDLCGEIDARLSRAVARRIEGEAALGVALSGGVDSGLIAAKVKAAGSRVLGYTLAYGDRYDEFPRVDFLASTLGIEVRKIRVAPGEVIANFEHASGIASEPVGFNNATLRIVALAAREDGIRTLLDGDGADRLFLGMNRHQGYARLLRAYRWLDRRGLVPYVGPALTRMPFNALRKAGLHFENWRRGIPPYAERGLGHVRRYDEAYERRVYDIAIAPHRESFLEEIGTEDFGLFFTWLAIQMCPEMFFHDPSELQQELGLFPMPAFFDDEVVGAALSLGTAWKLRDGRTKYILRRAAARALDARYWQLPKIGLPSAYLYAVASPEGRAWRSRRLQEARSLPEAALLDAVVPGGIEPERLLPLAVWKARHGI